MARRLTRARRMRGRKRRSKSVAVLAPGNHRFSFLTCVQYTPSWFLCIRVYSVRMFLVPLYLLLSVSLFLGLFSLLCLKTCKWFKKKTVEKGSNDSVDDSNDNTSKENGSLLSEHILSEDILTDFPFLLPMRQKILLNLRMVEYKLMELEQFLREYSLSENLKNKLLSYQNLHSDIAEGTK
ncbi:kita-kyushu lung cancer antigen 1 [Macrotis lagotis]|uniref:kita-kyushu lung cancer antigen 1 n=1 Tax=Macrotis lagotis TaxID=92651 RepID=UPI003D68E1A1